MKKNKKDGFTLIELLAVLTILAIISLIAVPQVLNIISNSKEKSSKTDVELFIKQLQNEVYNKGMSDLDMNINYCEVTAGRVLCDGNNLFKWDNDISGHVYFFENEIIGYNLNTNGFSYSNSDGITNEECFDYEQIGSSDTLEITGYHTDNDECHKYVGIPSSINNKTVVSIGNEAFKNQFLDVVIIPDTITSIGNYAFSSNSLTSIIIPNSVTSIGMYAFSNNNITSITIPNSLTNIGDYAFSHSNLKSIIIPNGITSIGKCAFECNKLTSVIIPDSVTSIGVLAFAGNNLTSVEIGTENSKLDSIGGAAFGGAYYDYGPNAITSIRIHKEENSLSLSNTGLEDFINNGATITWGIGQD